MAARISDTGTEGFPFGIRITGFFLAFAAIYRSLGYLFNDSRKQNVRGAAPGEGLPSSYRDNPVRDQTIYSSLIHVFNHDTTSETLNLVAAESATVRDRCVELATLEMPRRHLITKQDINPKYLDKILLRTYEAAPRDFESLLAIEGVGAKTLRALALTSELIYGTEASRRDPARYSFAHGGKDGTPFPVDRPTYDKTIEVMRDALNRSRIDRSEKVRAFKRLAEFTA